MLLACDEPLATAYDLALVDLDGVAYCGPDAVPHAPEALAGARAAGMGVMFVTNNASREPDTVAAQLRELGMTASADEVLTSAHAATALLVQEFRAGAKVLVVGGTGLITAVRGAGFELVASARDKPVAVVQGFGPDVTWNELAEAGYAIQAGARHIATNRDITQPKERGLAPGNGTLVAAVVAATGVEPASAGKPEPTMFRMAARMRAARRPLVVGDRLDTDLAGARAAGFAGLHVLTGVSTVRDVILAPPGQRPDFIGADLRSLLVPHTAPTRGVGGWWTCGMAAARVADGRIDLDAGGGNGLDMARAACAAAWSAVDSGADLDLAGVPNLSVDVD